MIALVSLVVAAIQDGPAGPWSSVPSWLIGGGIAAAAGYGGVRTTARSAEKAVSELRAHADKRLDDMDRKIDGISREVGALGNEAAGLRATVDMIKDEQLRIRDARDRENSR